MIQPPIPFTIKRFFFLLPVILSTFLPGCKKEDPPRTILHGRVTEYGTGAPIADARLYVVYEESEPFGPSLFTTVDSIITDADGRFYKEYAAGEICSSISMLPYKPGYFKGTPLYPTTDNKAFEVVLDPVSWLKVVTIPDGGINHLLVSGNFYGVGGFDAYAIDGVRAYIFETNGNKYKQIRWRPYGQLDLTQMDSIYLPAHDTTTYTIRY